MNVKAVKLNYNLSILIFQNENLIQDIIETIQVIS